MILSEHALRGNCNKLVKEFLRIPESATTWLDIIFVNILYEAGSRESDASARSFIVSVTQPVSYPFACHVSCKLRYFGKVANVERGFEGETMFFHFRSTVVP